MAQRVPRVLKIQPAAGAAAEEGFGFKLIGGIPIIVESVLPGSRAEAAGLLPGDRIVGVNGDAVNGLPHLRIIELIKKTPSTAPLRLIAVNDGPDAVSTLRQVKSDPKAADLNPVSTPSPSRLPRITAEAKISGKKRPAQVASPARKETPIKTPIKSEGSTTKIPLASPPEASPQKEPHGLDRARPGSHASRRRNERDSPTRSAGPIRVSRNGSVRRVASASPSHRSSPSPMKAATPQSPFSRGARSVKSADAGAQLWATFVSSEEPAHRHIVPEDAWQPSPETSGTGAGLFLGEPAYAFVRKLKQASVEKIVTNWFGSMQTMDHENVAPLFGVCRVKDSTCIVWKSSLKPLASVLETAAASLDVSKAYHTCQQICNGLHYLHNQGVVHGRLAVDAILASGDFGQLQLVEYGRTRKRDEKNISAADAVSDIQALGEVIAVVMKATQEPTPEADAIVEMCRAATESDCPDSELVCFKIACVLEDFEDDDDDDSDDDSSDDDEQTALGGQSEGAPASSEDVETMRDLTPIAPAEPAVSPANGSVATPNGADAVNGDEATNNNEEEDDDFFALMSRKKEETRNHDVAWTVEGDVILDGPSPEELDAMPDPERWSKHFRYLLDSEQGVQNFRKFLKTIVAQENIDFWVDCTALRNLEGDSTRLAQACEGIYKKYVATGASKAININGIQRATIDSFMQKRNFTEHTFGVAQKEIYFLMKRDSYPKYLDSEVYAKMLRSWSPVKQIKRAQRASTLSPIPSDKPTSKTRFFSFRKSKARS